MKPVLKMIFILSLSFPIILLSTSHKTQGITLDALVQLESNVWEALKNGDKTEDSRLLSNDFLGVYDSGFAGKQDHVNQLENGPTVYSYQIENPKMIPLSAHTALLSYQAIWQRVGKGVIGNKEVFYITSIWTFKNGKWENIFSQDTKKAE